MSPLKSTLETPAVSIPFTVRLEPYLVESICELSRLVRDKGSQNSDISGLLFGRVEAGVRTVAALKSFVEGGPHSELARRERWERAYKSTLEESRTDPELSTFDIVGWFSFRIGSGLLSSDVVFHNQHFRKPEDLALIIWREGSSQITVEVYSKSESDTLTSDDYRWGSLRLSADIRHIRDPIELAMRVKLSDDSYLRTYESSEPPSQLEALRRKAEAASERLLGFLYRRKEEAYTERVRGYIGDGTLPQRPLGIDNEPIAAINPQAYFNPYSEAAHARKLPARNDPPPAAPTEVPPSASWPPASSAAFAAAPARSPEPGPELRLTETSLPAADPSSESALVLSSIGHSPRSGRVHHHEVSGLPMVIRPAAVKKPFPLAWVATIFVVCSGLAFGFLAMGGLQSDDGRISQVFHAMFPGGELNLKVHNEDDRLRLTWNLRNHAVASASDATLQIFDGQQHRDVHLDGRQVADGSVLYRPVTNDVTFRLEVRGDQGAASGSVRVLDGLTSRQEVLDVSAPTTPAPLQTAAVTPSTDPALSPDSSLPAAAGIPPAGYTPASESPSLRDGTAAATTAAAPPPITEQPYIPPSTAARPPATQPYRSSRYVTPQNIGILPETGGATINGWATSTSKSRRPRQRAGVSGPVFPTVSSAPASTGYVAPRPVMQVMPNTRSIPNGTIQTRTRVEVQVDVDQTGRVSSAHVVSTGVNEQIANAALSAARQWTFDPATNNGQRINSIHTIVFEFRPEQR